VSPDEHWAENFCDGCDRPLKVAAGARCPKCIHEMELAEWLRGWVS
jgi:hypothetical protein